MTHSHFPIVLTIAGSDCSGGAGIQADLKTFSALATYGASVITSVVAENTCTVKDVSLVPTSNIAQQLDCVFSDLNVAAVKIGMLPSTEIMRLCAEFLQDQAVPMVLDPVMVSQSGHELMPRSSVDFLRSHLLPRADLITPNAPEAALLLDTAMATSTQGLLEQGSRLLDFGCQAVLMKSGHLDGAICSDVLIRANAEPVTCSHPRLATKNTHGIGCTYSAAIAAYLSRGFSMTEAVQKAHDYLFAAIKHADSLQVGSGQGSGPTHHFHALWPKPC